MNEDSIFSEALTKVQPAERAAYLDDACAEDPELRQRVEELLGGHAAAGSFLELPALGQRAEQPTPHSDETRALPAQADQPEVTLDFLQPATRPDALGRLGPYDILEVMGRGGMGIVLRAFDERLQRVVAVKVMSQAMVASGAARQRFIREARAAAAVSHEHIISIHEVQPDGPVPYLVMECIAGQSLDDKLKKCGPLSTQEVLRIGVQIAEGLQAAHRRGLIHRDIKPANILLENGIEKVKITDFGLARVCDDASVTQSGVIAGTPQYMSPEQAEGHSLDQRSDLFSLGSVLYALCTGRPPFRAATTMAVLKRVCEETPRPIREVNPEIPEALCNVIAKLHAKKPEARYQTASELAGELSQLLASGDALSAPSGGHKPPEKSPLSASALSGGSRPPLRSVRRWPRRVGVAVVLVLILATIAIWGNLIGRTKQLLYHELTLKLPDTQTVLEIWPTSDEVESPSLTRFSYHGPYPMEPTATIANKREKIVRLPPGNYWLHASRNGKRFEQHLLKIGWGGRQVVTIGEKGSGLAQRAAEPGWVQLFNGKDLTGWLQRADEAGQWQVAGGILTGTGPSHLFSERGDYADFHLRAEASLGVGSNSGVWFRTGFGTPRKLESGAAVPHGYEAEIFMGPGDWKSGSLTRLQPYAGELVKPDEWFTLEIVARGNRIQVLVDGVLTADYLDESKSHSKGHLALQALWEQSVVQFRKIEINEQPPSISPPSDRDLLQGKWRLVSAECEGKPVPVADLKDADWLMFSGDEQSSNWKGRIWKGTYQLNTAAQPKELDLLSTEYKPVRAVYQLDGDTLVIAQGIPDEPRPTSFKTTPTTTYGVYFYRRETTDGHSIAGDWIDQTGGIVTFQHGAMAAASPVPVTGGWRDAKTLGRFTRGTYDPRAFTIQLEFQDAIVQQAGRAKFVVSEDGSIITGTYVYPDAGLNSSWTLRRKPGPGVAFAPFSAEQAKVLQEAWAKHLGVDVELTNATGMKFRLLPPGQCMIGSSAEEIEKVLAETQDWNKPNVRTEGPIRTLRLDVPVYFGCHEVTVGQFREFVKEMGYKTVAEQTGKGGRSWDRQKRMMVLKPEMIWSNPFVAATDGQPVVLVTREDAEAFCKWLGTKDGRGYVLPTDELWEYACRAGSESRWYWGDDPTLISRYAWVEDAGTGARQFPVGQKLPNAFGLHDMAGNVAEMAIDQQGKIVFRGGHAGYPPPMYFRSAVREYENHSDPTYRSGFRILTLDLKPKEVPKER